VVAKEEKRGALWRGAKVNQIISAARRIRTR
jgi:hypothetical protein